ncbi:MAG TPA: M48 family peptidase [Nitrospirae bacterium]|nr:M48 family peptidase [Nitrospirota bacterium]
MKNFIKHPVLKHRYFRRLLVLLILLFLFLVLGYKQYRQVIYIPEDGSAFKLDNYSLGSKGDKPFYQTDDDLRLSRELSILSDSKAGYFFSKQYYRLYKRHYSEGKLMTQMIRVGKDQLPRIYNMVKDACEILGVKKVPNIYITKSNGTNMRITNRLNPTIFISSDFTWAFKPEELRFLLAREVAHIRLRHLYYLDIISGMRSFTGMALPKFVSEVIVGSIGIKLMQWDKEAEISADRGALVVTGDINVALQALVKLNIGANFEDNYPGLNIDAYINQLSSLKDDRIETASAVIHELENNNPFITVRVRNLSLWYKENDIIFK